MPSELDEILSHYSQLSGVHPACLAIPEIEVEDQEALNTSIAANGLRHEILLTHDGQLLDGRNRLIACHRGQVKPRFRRLNAEDDPWQAAFDENVARRHLSAKARALFGERWRRHEQVQAKERQRAAGGGAPESAPVSGGQDSLRVVNAESVNEKTQQNAGSCAAVATGDDPLKWATQDSKPSETRWETRVFPGEWNRRVEQVWPEAKHIRLI